MFQSCMDIQPARVALKAGCEGIAAINTIMSVMGINLTTLRPEPCVEGLAFHAMHILIAFISHQF